MSKDNPVSEFDCRPAAPIKPGLPPSPEIDYLARDFASFRRLMLDRLTAVLPDWQERNPADLGVALVEALAYAADQLSYYQDAVATEAYLGTARQRISVRRHARLLDYVVHEGCNARAWVQFRLQEGAGQVPLPQGTRLLTGSAGAEVHISDESADFFQALAAGAQVFETLHHAQLLPEHNQIHFLRSWETSDDYLPEGSVQADLIGNLPALAVGDALIFEELPTQQVGADPRHRHAVRLINIVRDSAKGITSIEWHAQDALPFDMLKSRSVACGNVVLADHGWTQRLGERLPQVPGSGTYRPSLQKADLTFASAYSDTLARKQAASTALTQDPRAALPAVVLDISGERWTARRDLLGSDRFAHDFVVEVDNAGQAHLRFGDGVRGKRPPANAIPIAFYRIGNGLGGNVGQESIGLVVMDAPRIQEVRNPLSARAGCRPESIEQVRLRAPQAFQTQERCVTAADYVEAAQRHPEVDRAAAALRWTGGWHTMFVALERKNGRPVDGVFLAEVRAFMERFRLAGYDLEICAPRYLPLDIALKVHVAPHSFRATVGQALAEAFSDVNLPDGRRGFFHPDNLTFNQPVYLSQMIANAMRLPGVEWVEVVRFQQFGQPEQDELNQGRIKVGNLEIARLDNDPAAPQNGRIEFIMEGGL